MKYAILGSGGVGQTIATALLKNDHEVILGSRSKENPKALAWLGTQHGQASMATFAEAVVQGDVIFLALNGDKAIDAIRLAGPEKFSGKTVIDLTNPLDFSKGLPPSLLNAYKDRSLSEEIQETLHDASVVKALNTVTAKLMVDPSAVHDGEHDLFICGNDSEAKNHVSDLLAQSRLMQSQGTPMFNVKVVR